MLRTSIFLLNYLLPLYLFHELCEFFFFNFSLQRIILRYFFSIVIAIFHQLIIFVLVLLYSYLLISYFNLFSLINFFFFLPCFTDKTAYFCEIIQHQTLYDHPLLMFMIKVVKRTKIIYQNVINPFFLCFSSSFSSYNFFFFRSFCLFFSFRCAKFLRLGSNSQFFYDIICV